MKRPRWLDWYRTRFIGFGFCWQHVEPGVVVIISLPYLNITIDTGEGK